LAWFFFEGFTESASFFLSVLSLLAAGFSSVVSLVGCLILAPLDSTMMPQRRRCKCLNCKELFLPHRRSAKRQQFCAKPDCRKASKRESQKAWLAKPGNQDYFWDAKNAERVRDWQKEHPDYWKNTVRYRRRTVQEACPTQSPAVQEPTTTSPNRTLQDLCSMQTPLSVWLISMLVDSTLQEDLANTARRLVTKGHNILGMALGMHLERPMHEKRVLNPEHRPSSVGSTTGWCGKITSRGVITPPGPSTCF
jgi:hypothetical protein